MAKQRNKQGIYELSETINGKSSWKSATQAIWYYPEHNIWAIGSLSDIGRIPNWGISSFGPPYTKYDSPQKVPKDKWNYWDGKHFALASSTDIIIQCLGIKENNQKTFDS